MKKIIFTLAIFLALAGCGMNTNPDQAADKTEEITGLMSAAGTGLSEEFIFLFRVPASDPEGSPLKFTIVSQPVRGMFSINAMGDMYITKSMLDNIQRWYGKELVVVVGVSDGVNFTKAEMKFIVVKSPDGKHFLKRNIA
jgi:hypothetical protein